MFEKLGGDHGTDRVTPEVLRPGAAAPITKEASDRVGAAGDERLAQDIKLGHRPSMALSTSPQGGPVRRRIYCEACRISASRAAISLSTSDLGSGRSTGK